MNYKCWNRKILNKSYNLQYRDKKEKGDQLWLDQ